jgi:hypothetical protein
LACQLISIHQKRERDFIHEYHKRVSPPHPQWQAYVSSAIKLDDMLQPIAQLFNEVYEKIHFGQPSGPKFTIWRLMMVVWRREVFDKLQQELIQKLKEILNRFHKSQLQQGIN